MSLISSLIARQNASAPPPPPPPTGLDIRLTMAPPYFGSNCGWLFLGLMLVQTYTYYTSFRRDHWLLKAFVYSAVVLELVESGVETYVGYYYLVGGWGKENTILIPPKPLLFQPVLDALLGFMVQNFFIWRIWSFGKGPLVKGICLVLAGLSIVSMGCALAIPIIFLNIDVQSLLFTEAHVVTTTWLIASCIADMMITICMIIILRNAKSRAYFSETQDKISRLMRLTIQTGTLTSVLALVILLFFTQIHEGNMHTWPGYILGKSYAMSLLANLNARADKSVRHPSQPATSITFLPRGSKQTTSKFGNLSFLRSFTSGMDAKSETTVQVHTQRSVQESVSYGGQKSDFTGSTHTGTPDDVIHLQSYSSGHGFNKGPSDSVV